VRGQLNWSLFWENDFSALYQLAGRVGYFFGPITASEDYKFDERIESVFCNSCRIGNKGLCSRRPQRLIKMSVIFPSIPVLPLKQ